MAGKNRLRRRIVADGVVYESFTHAMAITGLSRQTIKDRIARGVEGYRFADREETPVAWVTRPVRKVSVTKQFGFRFNGVTYPSMAEAARRTGHSYADLHKKSKSGNKECGFLSSIMSSPGTSADIDHQADV